MPVSQRKQLPLLPPPQTTTVIRPPGMPPMMQPASAVKALPLPPPVIPGVAFRAASLPSALGSSTHSETPQGVLLTTQQAEVFEPGAMYSIHIDP